MLLQCPYPECAQTAEFEESSRAARGLCPHCGRPASFRNPDGLKQIEMWWCKRKEAGAERGGPPFDETVPAPLSCIVEDVRSLWNVGSILRTADGGGFSRVYLCGISGCPPRKEIAKTSLGAEETVSWQYAKSVLDVIPQLKKQGVTIIGLERTPESKDLSQELSNGSIALPVTVIVGNEVTGLSAEALAQCDVVCHLPMRGMKESLNVAVAFGVAAYMLAENLIP